MSAVVIVATAFLPVDVRLFLWMAFAAAWIVGMLMVGWRARVGLDPGMTPTESLVERFGLFILIVLGEVIFGVVEGLSLAEHDVTTISTGILALVLGFGFWWTTSKSSHERRPPVDARHRS